MKFFRCKHCGNIIVMMEDSGVNVQCCGEKMAEVVPGTVEAAAEKHIPVVSITGSTVSVNVGSVDHPMLPEHFIRWIVLETSEGFLVKNLKPGDKPAATFVADAEAIAVYAYCNLHSLWKNG
ncbi:MAG: desulfoferrodoxin [Ruminococcus sp.]|jgi:superoxide reductase|nr:desulfoferrodoxin [Ruminococcus sp.]